jgi:hypothetical protein
MTEQQTYTSSQHHLLEWLAKEDHSAYGECKGRDLDRLFDLGLARVVITDQRGQDFNRVGLTDKGFEEAKRLGEWAGQ